MKFTPTSALPEVILVEPVVHRDPRGFFLEFFHAGKYRAGGIDAVFVQDNHSCSLRGTLRGLHAQLAPRAQGKLVRVVEGEIFDVAVDARVGSPSFGHYTSSVLSAENQHQLWIPAGFLHGFCVQSERAQVEYKCTDFYSPDDEIGVAWNDPEIGVPWPIREPLLSDKDRAAPPLAALRERLPRWTGPGG